MDETTVAAIRHRLGAELAPPGHPYRPLLVGHAVAGWLDDARAAQLASYADVFAVRRNEITFIRRIDSVVARTAALERVTRTLAADGQLTAWRDERYAVAPALEAPPWFEIERAAARFFGVHTYAAHVNGLVRRGDNIWMWIARRSATKSIDPGKLDNFVAGGIAAGRSVMATVVSEAWEEAGIAAPVAVLAQPAGAVHICREQPDGLQRETIFVHDLWLAADYVPVGQDGEVAAHRLVPLSEVGTLVANDAGEDVVTADAALVMLDCLLRHGAIPPDAAAYLALEGLRHPAMIPGAQAALG